MHVPFQPYPKIPSETKGWDPEGRKALDRRQWVATEKIHGANLCLCTNGTQVAVAKRKQILAPDEFFFGYKNAVRSLLPNIRRLHQALGPETRWLFLYGELFGGTYPHPKVMHENQSTPVQLGVSYAPDVRFCAFDMQIVTAAGRKFLSFERACKLLAQFEIPTVPIVKVGSLTQLLALPASFETEIPRKLRLPSIAENWAEGLVIKPWDTEFSEGQFRPVLKRIHTAFRDVNPRIAAAAPILAEDPLNAAETITRSMVSQNRIARAMSKTGRLADITASCALVGEELMLDIRDAFAEQHGQLLLSLTPEDQNLLWEVVSDEIREAVLAFFEPIESIDPKRYYADLAWAFLRGRLPDAGVGEDLIATAIEKELRWHKFKRKQGPPRVAQVLSILRGIAPTSLLDIGPGRGAFLWPLLAHFPDIHVTAVDRLTHRVRDIEAVRVGGISRVNAQLGDASSLSFGDNQFDVVTILEVLEHVSDPVPVAAEVMRVAKHFVVASVPSHEDDNPEHIRLFTKDSLTRLFLGAGAKQVQIQYVLNHMIAVIQ